MIALAAKLALPVLVATELLLRLLHVGWLTLLTLAGIAAGIAGTGYLLRLARRGWRNAKAVVKLVVEIILSLPDRVGAIEARLADGEAHFTRQDERLDRIDKAIDVIADTNAARVDDALAGDERKPRVDRRRHAA